jgi:molecular chaperone Hsp33
LGDWLIRGLVGTDARLFAVDATVLAEHTRQLHELRGDAVRLAAEAVVATLFLGAHIKGEERISLQIQGAQPKCAYMGDVDADGGLRARLTPEVVRLPNGGRLEGMLLVEKTLPGQEIYRGVTAIEAQTIESALSRHLGESAQVDAILRIGADVDAKGRVVWAGGVLLERMPAAVPMDTLAASAEFAVRFDPLRGQRVGDILAAVRSGSLEGAPIQRLEERTLCWRCSCGQERVEAVIASMGLEELEAMLAEDGGAEVVCHFCNVSYTVSSDRLQQLISAQS